MTLGFRVPRVAQGFVHQQYGWSLGIEFVRPPHVRLENSFGDRAEGRIVQLQGKGLLRN